MKIKKINGGMHKLDDFDEQDENEVYDEENDDIY